VLTARPYEMTREGSVVDSARFRCRRSHFRKSRVADRADLEHATFMGGILTIVSITVNRILFGRIEVQVDLCRYRVSEDR
jgi:hypothetical protein